jgi:hypothetical protein
MTTLISGGLTNQNSSRPRLQVAAKPLQSCSRTIQIAVVQLVTLSPGIEDICSAAERQQTKEAANGFDLGSPFNQSGVTGMQIWQSNTPVAGSKVEPGG